MVRAWTILFGLGFLGLWLNYFAGPTSPGDGAWLAWVDVALGAITLVIAGMLHRSARKTELVAAPIFLGILAIAACIIGMQLIGSSQLVWGNFGLAVCFFILGGAAAAQRVKTVVRRPSAAEIGPEAVAPAPEPAAGPDAEKIWEDYGPRNLGGFEYQQRAGYRERDTPAADGRFWGVGPKGYLRTDIQIANEISEKMARDSELDASGIEVDVRYGDVTLRGKVIDSSAAARAGHICRSTLGVGEVHNLLKIPEKAA
jgi:hypothetical protein